MIHFNLNYHNLIHRDLSDKLSIIETVDRDIIQESINNFNNEIMWDGMFDLNKTIRRFREGDKFFVAKYNGEIFGHCWLKKESTNKFYIYNVFSKELPTGRPYGATDMLYEVIKNNTHGTICSEVDEWNEKSMKVFRKLGFIDI